VTGVRYADKPWLTLLDEAQKAPVSPADSLVHALRRAVAEDPERTFLAYFDGRLGYREADELSDSVAGHLAARGLERGDRVAVLLQNSPHFVIAVLGAWKAGAVVVPVNPMYKSGEVAHVLRDGEVAALICSDRAWESYLRDTAKDSPVRIVLTGCELDFQTRGDSRVLTFERLPQAADADDLTPPAPAAPPRAPPTRTATSCTTPSGSGPGSGCPRRRCTSRWRRCSTSPGWSASSGPV
jgi:long-chain acyl-CoA synthetase